MYCTFASTWHDDIIWSTIWSNYWHGLHLLYVSVCNTFFLQDILFLIPESCAAIIPLSVSAFIFPLYSHRNVSSSQISCVPTLLIYCSCITLPSCFLQLSLILSCIECLPFLCHCFHLICLIFPQPLIVKFMFDWLLAWILTVSTIWSHLYFVFRHSATMITSIASVSNRPLPLYFLFIYRLSIPSFALCILCTVSIFLFFLISKQL